jgi:hypothetical protein
MPMGHVCIALFKLCELLIIAVYCLVSRMIAGWTTETIQSEVSNQAQFRLFFSRAIILYEAVRLEPADGLAI